MRYIDHKAVKKIVLAALKRRYPGVRFTGRIPQSRTALALDITYPEDSAIDSREINDFLSRFPGSDFDSMTDSKCYRTHWLLPDGTVELAHSPPMSHYPEFRSDRPEGAEEVHLAIDFIDARRKEPPDEPWRLRDDTPANGRGGPPLGLAFAFDRIIGQSDEDWILGCVERVSDYAPDLAIALARPDDEPFSEWVARSKENIALLEEGATAKPSLHPKIVELPVELQHTESALAEIRIPQRELWRREAKLVLAFQDYMLSHGFTAVRHSIRAPGETSDMLTDIYIPKLNLLLEAKGFPLRSHFRMAIGQLRDYARFYSNPDCGILLPSRPCNDLCDLAARQQILVYWPDGTGAFSGTDSRFPLTDTMGH